MIKRLGLLGTLGQTKRTSSPVAPLQEGRTAWLGWINTGQPRPGVELDKRRDSEGSDPDPCDPLSQCSALLAHPIDGPGLQRL